MKPLEKLTVSQWAEQNRQLSPESSSQPGKWYNANAPYLTEIMDCFNNPAIEKIVLEFASQLGKSEAINNILGFIIDLDPGPVAIFQPTIQAATDYSKDRLAPMLRDTVCLRGKVSEEKSRESDNTLLNKKFEGGYLILAGANSPSSLASRPLRVVLLDEVDRYEASAGKEGNPIKLAETRTTNFPANRKIVICSSPGLENTSRIEPEYQNSDRRKCFVPCPSCQKKQLLVFSQLKWEKENIDGETIHKPETVYYECVYCGFHMKEKDKRWMLQNREWKAERPTRKIAGFQLNGLYSTLGLTWENVVEKNLAAVKSGDPEDLKTFINTVLAETWKQKGETVDPIQLMTRLEFYGPDIPKKVQVLTAAVDVQDDRLELLLVGWGKGFESWAIEYKIFNGNPLRTNVWEELNLYLQQPFKRIDGYLMRVATCLIDSGFLTENVYSFCKGKGLRRIFPLKGRGGNLTDLIKERVLEDKWNLRLFVVGVDQAKRDLYHRLKLPDDGPGYFHFPHNPAFDESFFNQLTAEELIKSFKKGKSEWRWIKKRGKVRNEALDLAAYNWAAIQSLNANFNKLEAQSNMDGLVPSIQSP